MDNVLWYHPESDSYFVDTKENIGSRMESGDINACLCEDVTEYEHHILAAKKQGIMLSK